MHKVDYMVWWHLKGTMGQGRVQFCMSSAAPSQPGTNSSAAADGTELVLKLADLLWGPGLTPEKLLLLTDGCLFIRNTISETREQLAQAIVTFDKAVLIAVKGKNQ